ncbi:hypothetical protein [Yoonia sp.]|uniref:hypothetical protein n=1 Tax=Yoonia sp. TaxID=2212373 RepID=UPI0035C7E282
MAQAKVLIATVTFMVILTTSAQAQPQQCAGANVSVTAENQDDIDLACEAAAKTVSLFAECAIPALSEPTKIEIVDDIPQGCFGLFHCDTRLIEVLSRDALDGARRPESALSFLATDDFFQSIVVHELTHAATEGMPCPFDGCVVGPEYVAYLIQLRSLDHEAREVFESTIDMQSPVMPDSFHPIIILMSPDLFSQRVWAHHWQLDDPCGFVGELMRGESILDFELFDAD